MQHRYPCRTHPMAYSFAVVPVLLCLLLGPAAVGQSADVEDILSLVRTDSLLKTVRVLSGEEVAVTPESTFTVPTRWHENNDAAMHYVRHRLQTYGYATSLQVFDRGVNVIGLRIGASQPDRFVIICAHYDAVRDTPGADDNASGTAAVVEAARVLSSTVLSSTVVFALWDAEEIGLVGSAFYASEAARVDTDIAAVINLDMIGWDGEPAEEGGPDGVLELHSDIASTSLAASIADLVPTYGLQLDPVVVAQGTSASDHASFWRNGYQAVLLIEELQGGDFNPYYHQPTDQLINFNTDFFSEAASLAIAAVAEIAGVVPVAADAIEAEGLPRIRVSGHPLPFSSRLSIRYELPAAGSTRLSVYDVLGREVAVVADGWHSAGRHLTRWSTSTLPAGVYFLHVRTQESQHVVPVVKSD